MLIKDGWLDVVGFIFRRREGQNGMEAFSQFVTGPLHFFFPRGTLTLT